MRCARHATSVPSTSSSVKPHCLFVVCTAQERDGWYTTHAFEQIKTVLRHKFFALLEGHPATDAECAALLAASEGSVKTALAHRSAKLRAGKHNMAKGALRPEDAAVCVCISVKWGALIWVIFGWAGAEAEGNAGSQHEVVCEPEVGAMLCGRQLVKIARGAMERLGCCLLTYSKCMHVSSISNELIGDIHQPPKRSPCHLQLS